MAQPAQQRQSSSSTAASSSSSFSQIFIPQTAAAGGVLITQPPQSSTSFFKIAPSQPVTFAWNMTSVIVTPTHLTVSAVCDNGNTYPVGPTDGIIPGTASSVVWDLYAYQTNNPNKPLAQATYTLNIWGDQGPGAPRRPGYLEQNSALQFALYTPQPYTPLASGKELSFPFHLILVITVLIARMVLCCMQRRHVHCSPSRLHQPFRDILHHLLFGVPSPAGISKVNLNYFLVTVRSWVFILWNISSPYFVRHRTLFHTELLLLLTFLLPVQKLSHLITSYHHFHYFGLHDRQLRMRTDPSFLCRRLYQ